MCDRVSTDVDLRGARQANHLAGVKATMAVACYFGLAEFGRIYGWQYAAFVFASGLGPLWVGAIRDHSGSYRLALVISAIGLMVACSAFLLLPRYQARATAGVFERISAS